ncbi:hypothetical protein FAIPA1_260050 [Frankia sp. AiPs1]
MMPALLTRTLSPGWLAATVSRARAIESGSATSRLSASMPGCSAMISSRRSLRRPATITLLPASKRRRARPSPMPEVPPVIRIVLPVIFIGVPLLRRGGLVGAHSLDRRGAHAGAAEEDLSMDRLSLPGGVVPPGRCGVAVSGVAASDLTSPKIAV